jgi:hypothetical protein
MLPLPGNALVIGAAHCRREMQVGQTLRDALRQSGCGSDGCTAERGILQETAAACFGRELSIQSVHGRILSGKMVAGAAVRSKRSERRY